MIGRTDLLVQRNEMATMHYIRMSGSDWSGTEIRYKTGGQCVLSEYKVNRSVGSRSSGRLKF